MNSALMFSKASDLWSTPQDLFDALDAEFHFDIDVAADESNHKCDIYLTEGMDALRQEWDCGFGDRGTVAWMNPPYSKCREFIARASAMRHAGVTTVALVPSRTDTRWWHDHVWNRAANAPYANVEVRFIKGRVKFGGAAQGAPFPSVVIVFRAFAGAVAELVERASGPVETPLFAVLESA